jgi:hypothetical protein
MTIHHCRFQPFAAFAASPVWTKVPAGIRAFVATRFFLGRVGTPAFG